MSELLERPAWQAGAACRNADPAIFFPDDAGITAEAKALCAGCAVRPECLAYALTRPEHHGIWGGASARRRERIRKTAGLRRPEPRGEAVGW